MNNNINTVLIKIDKRVELIDHHNYNNLKLILN